MASTDILSQTLSAITTTKLDQLQKQKEAYETRKRRLLEDVSSETDTTERAKKLLKGSENLLSAGLKTNLAVGNLKAFLDQAAYDPSVSEALLKDYEAELRGYLQAQTNKYEFASLYSKLVNEWIASGASGAASASATEGSSGFVVVGREEMHQQRATWEEYVFKEKKTEAEAIRAYLNDIFSSKEAQAALETVRATFKEFQRNWKSQQHFNETTLKTCINGMLRSDILTEEKRTTLRDFADNKVVLAEIADVLNVSMNMIDTWSWSAPLVVEQRRNLNGRYRFYTDEDLLDSIFVYYIGLKWATELREVLQRFIRTEGVWKADTKPISKADARRRRFFLGEPSSLPRYSVQKLRDQHFKDILLNQLPASFDEVKDSYGGLGKQPGDTKQSHAEVVQTLLQRLQAEVIMQTKLGREMTVIRSDFKWFGPSLPHSSIFAALDFFGVNAEWRDLFKRVLEASMRFKQDSPDTPAQVRKRGTLMSTPVADFFAESILFCLDYAVNQKANGTRLYRLHDDMWLWGSSETCASAWKVITEFTDTMGLEINQDKTGCARITKGSASGTSTSSATAKKETAAQPSTLPTGDVTWGFLKLDPSTGRFQINQAEVDKHIDELRLQLSACNSVLDYVQAWNIYGNRFFANNFGQPATCYGAAHLDSMLATFQRIQQRLFPDHPGGVGEHLKRTIASKFGTDIPDGFLYWPTSMGGLGLQNPFITVQMSRQHIKSPEEAMDKFLQQEELKYNRDKARFEEGIGEAGDASDSDSSSSSSSTTSAVWRGDAPEYADLRAEKAFMSLDEYTRYRERTSYLLAEAYLSLMESPDPASVESSGAVKAVLPEEAWRALSDYEKWVVQQHHRDMVARFGGLDVVDKGLLPTGLMTMLRKSQFRWQG